MIRPVTLLVGPGNLLGNAVSNRLVPSLSPPIDVSTMSDAVDGDHSLEVVNGIDDAVVANANPVGVLEAGQFFATRGPWFGGKAIDPRDHPLLEISSKALERLGSFVAEDDLVALHLHQSRLDLDLLPRDLHVGGFLTTLNDRKLVLEVLDPVKQGGVLSHALDRSDRLAMAQDNEAPVG